MLVTMQGWGDHWHLIPGNRNVRCAARYGIVFTEEQRPCPKFLYLGKVYLTFLSLSFFIFTMKTLGEIISED